MKQKYIIIRKPEIRFEFDPMNFSMMKNVEEESSNFFNSSIDIDELNKKDISNLNKDKNTILIPSIPLKLVEPTEIKDFTNSANIDFTWGVEATGALNSTYDGKDIKVAVLDTGIDASHPAFEGVNIIQKNFTNDSDIDEHGHGTHCAGTIFGRDVNGIRIGVAKGINNALIGKVLGTNGGSTENIIKAIQWAVNEGANVISMSLGVDFPGYVQQLIDNNYPTDLATSIALEGYRKNIKLYSDLAQMLHNRSSIYNNFTVLVAAAGNDSKRNINPNYEISVSPPAVADKIISVGALQRDINNKLDVAYFSNTNPDLSAPGVNIVSAKLGGGLTSMSGTSMATPHVAGVFALWAEKLKNSGRISTLELKARVIGNTTKNNLVENFDPYDLGAGLVQAP